jgi:cytoskeletal protein RodZ
MHQVKKKKKKNNKKEKEKERDVKKKKQKEKNKREKKEREKKVLLKQHILSFIVLIKVNFFFNRDFCSFSFSRKKIRFMSFSFDSLFL